MAEFALIVVAYNRPKALNALLQSLQRAVYEMPVDLIFCLEHDPPQNLMSVVNTFEWQHGEVTVAESAEFLGLRKQMIRAFSMAVNYAGIVVLEDDVQVAPGFFAWYASWFQHMSNDPLVAGCALYHQHFHYVTEFPFWPLHDGSDHYFLQVPCSWGTGHTKAQALGLAQWLKDHQTISHPAGIPSVVQHWPDTSWKKTATEWLVKNGTYWCYPRNGFSTTGSEPGTHQAKEEQALQSPMSMQTDGFRWQDCATSMARYDAFMEWQPPQLVDIPGVRGPVDWDLHGMKTKMDLAHNYVITRRQVKQAEQSWGRSLKPPELNIAQQIPGNFFVLCTTQDFEKAAPNPEGIPADWDYYVVNTSGRKLIPWLFDKLKQRWKR